MKSARPGYLRRKSYVAVRELEVDRQQQAGDMPSPSVMGVAQGLGVAQIGNPGLHLEGQRRKGAVEFILNAAEGASAWPAHTST